MHTITSAEREHEFRLLEDALDAGEIDAYSFKAKSDALFMRRVVETPPTRRAVEQPPPPKTEDFTLRVTKIVALFFEKCTPKIIERFELGEKEIKELQACARDLKSKNDALHQRITSLEFKLGALVLSIGSRAGPPEKLAEIEALLSRVAELERRGINYRGVYREGEHYDKGQFATHSGSLWHCNESTSARPGTNGEWTLAVKRGQNRETT